MSLVGRLMATAALLAPKMEAIGALTTQEVLPITNVRGSGHEIRRFYARTSGLSGFAAFGYMSPSQRRKLARGRDVTSKHHYFKPAIARY